MQNVHVGILDSDIIFRLFLGLKIFFFSILKVVFCDLCVCVCVQ